MSQNQMQNKHPGANNQDNNMNSHTSAQWQCGRGAEKAIASPNLGCWKILWLESCCKNCKFVAEIPNVGEI